MPHRLAIWHLIILIMIAALISDVIANPNLIAQAKRFPSLLVEVCRDVFVDGPERERVFTHNSHLGERRTQWSR